ncbi:MAG: GlcNAc-PI de-N-acetylase [Acidimicrobiia bacterium]|jgi:LmbE family N-acetylglucosaminyl deacetylase|nr:GlcNAc-PI de-N-acetylase [Acidimicrobiia bacterium]NDG10716.1 GlcNAc-PI de-N-acetylase [Actinomycetota bacterium]
MATIVFLHAHPDDECLISGGTIAKYSSAGHRLVLVTATDGRHGEKPEGITTPEQLLERRREELAKAAAVLGVSRHEWLGYVDSGMTGWPQNNEPGAFIRSEVDEAAARLARIVDEERRDADRLVLVGYDWHGNYGHPDHVHVHKVARRVRELSRVDDFFEVTLNRDFYVAAFEWSKNNGGDNDFDPREPADDGNPMGEPETNITHHIDVSQHVDAKRRAIASHASQANDTGFATEMSEDSFLRAFGTEWFIKVGEPAPSRRTTLLD